MALSRIGAIGAVAVCAGLAQATITVVGDARRISAFATAADDLATLTDGPHTTRPPGGESFSGMLRASAPLRSGGALARAEQTVQISPIQLSVSGRAFASASSFGQESASAASADSVIDLSFTVPPGSEMVVSLSSQNSAVTELLTNSGETIFAGSGYLVFTAPDATLRLRTTANVDVSATIPPGSSRSEASFSALVRIVPCPGSLAILPAAGLCAMGRRRAGRDRPRP